jgi:predicted transcriptional regulator
MAERRDRREAVLIHLPHQLKRDITRVARENRRSRVHEIEVAISNHVTRVSSTPHEQTHAAASASA